jgi:transcriptional regulator with XRE-family HTH domain
VSFSKKINQKKIQAAMLLAGGSTQEAVATELNISVRTLQRWLKDDDFNKLINDVLHEVADTTVKMTSENLVKDANRVFSYAQKQNLILQEIAHLDLALSCVLPMVESGSLRAVETLLKISERRCKLLALDQPRNNIIDAMNVLAQFGVIKSSQVTSVNQIFDNVDVQLTQLGSE